ncbi:MAG: SRPBCC family protein [Pseudomonadota bacterium]
MLTIVTVIAIIVAIAIAAILIRAATKPDHFRIARTATIDAPAERIFPLINDLQSFKLWSPFEKDPAMRRDISTPSSGKGATYAWNGNKTVGSGRMQITESTTPSQVKIDLEMLTPFAASNKVEFTLVPRGGGTELTWAMQGSSPFMMRVMSTFFDMDKTVGGDFEKGLANLKRITER